MPMFSKLNKNEVGRKKYQVRKDLINKPQHKTCREKKHQISNLNYKILKSEINDCTKIKKPRINLFTDTNLDHSSKNVLENFSNIENDNFK